MIFAQQTIEILIKANNCVDAQQKIRNLLNAPDNLPIEDQFHTWEWFGVSLVKNRDKFTHRAIIRVMMHKEASEIPDDDVITPRLGPGFYFNEIKWTNVTERYLDFDNPHLREHLSTNWLLVSVHLK